MWQDVFPIPSNGTYTGVSHGHLLELEYQTCLDYPQKILSGKLIKYYVLLGGTDCKLESPEMPVFIMDTRGRHLTINNVNTLMTPKHNFLRRIKGFLFCFL